MPELPTGIVTFLFTDVEGSTRLLARLGERYQDVQGPHDAILRSAIVAGDGQELSTEGDSFFAVFTSPSGAVRAAAQAQRELAVMEWPDGAVVRVRMGLHTGEGLLGGRNYLGLEVNRAARIGAAAHGGQVLLSDATRVLVERTLPDGTRLKDLGQHRLRGLDDPDHLYQLVIDGLQQDFAPPRTLDARPNDLPAQITRFIGRTNEMAEVSESLRASRLVTLTGPGGMGKTRLALEVAARARATFRDGVTFVDLTTLTDSELVPQEIASALRVRPEPERPVLETLADHLREKQLLLVLDNFEEVVDAGPAVLEPLLRAAPGVKALVTSRVRVGIYGEHEYQVPPLALPDPGRPADTEAATSFAAIELFVVRAAAHRSGFHITPENARAVAAIAARLDGMPLAIELAASRLRVLSPEQLLERLERSLPLLTSQERNVPERQRTVRRTIEWSYELLDGSERRLFWRLSVFAGGTTLDAAEGIVNPDDELGLDTLDGITSLIDKNLVRSGDASSSEPRFTMLETIREFGLERLSESDDESFIHRRHAEFWAQVAEEASKALSGPEQTATTRRLELDHGNFRSALGWASRSGEVESGLRLSAALREYWRLAGHLAEGGRWLKSLLGLPQAAERTPLRARALTAAADVASWTGARETYFRLADEAVSIYRDLEDPRGIADALEELGVAHMQAGRLDVARADMEEARKLQRGLGNRQKAAECSLVLGMIAAFEGRGGDARGNLQDGLTTFNDLGDPYWTAFAERLLGGADRVDGDLETAEERFRASLSAHRLHDLPSIAATALYAFADLALARGQHERALRLAGASHAVVERLGEDQSMEVAIVGDVREAALPFVDAAEADRWYEEGRAMALEDAVEYALLRLEP